MEFSYPKDPKAIGVCLYPLSIPVENTIPWIFLGEGYNSNSVRSQVLLHSLRNTNKLSGVVAREWLLFSSSLVHPHIYILYIIKIKNISFYLFYHEANHNLKSSYFKGRVLGATIFFKIKTFI
jgi:hypothetical protein